MTQAQLAVAVGVTRGYVAMIEGGRANPTLDVVEKLGRALSLDMGLVIRPPAVLGSQQGDLVHARCSGYVDRRLRAGGWQTAREVEVVQGRSHGWIDLLAFDPVTRVLLVIEIKTRFDDVGSTERQLGWYVRAAPDLARSFGWRPGRVLGWLLVLASEEVEAGLRRNRDVVDRSFPSRAKHMQHVLDRAVAIPGTWSIGLVDPSRRRHDWILRSRLDGRRSDSPYVDYAAAAATLSR